MNADIQYLMEQLKGQRENSQIYVSYKDKVSKVSKEEYCPDENGLVVFNSTIDWRQTGYSVYEMLEFFRNYEDKVCKIRFRWLDGKEHDFISVYESDLYSSFSEYSCVIQIGVPGKGTYKQEGKVLDNYNVSDMMYTGILHN